MQNPQLPQGPTGQQSPPAYWWARPENPIGTAISGTITQETFFLRLNFSNYRGTSDTVLSESSAARPAAAAAMRVTVTSGFTIEVGTPIPLASTVVDNVANIGGTTPAWKIYHIPITITRTTSVTSGTITITHNPTSNIQTSGVVLRRVFGARVLWQLSAADGIWTQHPQGTYSFSVNPPVRPRLVIGAPQAPVGTFLDEEVNHTTFYTDMTWDRAVSAEFTQSDCTATSSNTGMSVACTDLTNVGTAGTSTHFRAEWTVTGTGITDAVLTIPAGAIPAAGGLGSSEERRRSVSINTFPAPSASFGAAQDAEGNPLSDPITATEFFIPITWDRDVRDAFTAADLNVVSNSATVQGNVPSITEVTPGRVFNALLNVTGGGTAILTIHTNRGAIPATATTSSSVVQTATYSVSQPALPPPTGTMAGPTVTQSGGSVLLKPDDITDVDAPILDIEVTNLTEAKQSSNTPIEIGIAFTFDKPVTGFNEATPNYTFKPRDIEATDPTKTPQLGIFSGVDGNATYQQTIEIQPNSAGEINVFVAPNSSVDSADDEVYGPAPPGASLEVFYDTTIAGNPAPTVNISTPPTTYFRGAQFTTTFFWDQPIERGTFRASQVYIVGATPGPLVPDPNRRDTFTMQLTLPDAGKGEVTITVLNSNVVSTAALGIISRREGPIETETENFLYDQAFTVTTPVIAGGSTICEITERIRTNPNLDQVLSPIPYGGAFAGVSDMVFIRNSATQTNYLYCIVQMIKRRPGTQDGLSNLTEAGAFLMEVNLRTNQCRTIKQWAFCTIAGRSLVAHDNQVFWFEGSHYGNRRRSAIVTTTPDADGHISRVYPEHVGNLFSLTAGETAIQNHGVTWRSQFDYPAQDVVVPDYGFHTQTASPLVVGGDDIFLVSGFGGLSDITSTLYATSQRGPQGVNVATDIGNWQFIKYSQDVEQRVALFDGNNQKGWDAIHSLAIISDSFIGVDKNGVFYFVSKGGTNAEVQNSAPQSLEYRNENRPFPQVGILEVNGEVIAYDGIIGRQFLNLNRGQYGTTVQTISEGHTIRLIKSVLNTNQPVFDEVLNSDIRDLAKHLYNKIVITYADDQVFEYQDDDSIATYGERIFEMTAPLSIHQTIWLEEIARRFINEHKDLHYLITVRMTEDYELETTDVVFLLIPERSLLTRACQIYEITREPESREVELVLKTL